MNHLIALPLSKIMVHNLVTLSTEDTMDQAKEIFDKKKFHHIVVVNEAGKLAGILSRTDLDRLTWGRSFFKNPQKSEMNEILLRSLRVCDVMTKEVVHLKSDSSVAQACELFKQGQFRAIPIIDGDKLVGIVTPIDLLDLMYNL